MHVAMILDEERLRHEHRLLNRLAIGLMGEGLTLTRIVPEMPESPALDEDEQRVGLAHRLETLMSVLPWVRKERTARLTESLEKTPPDVLYAVGEDTWNLGLDLARALERPLAIEIWATGQVRKVPRGRAAGPIAGYVAPTTPMAQALGERVDPELVCVVPPGVGLPVEPRMVLEDPERSVALAVLGGGRDVPAYRALLTGLSGVIRRMPQVQVFLELDGPNDHEIWRHARRLELLENISSFTDVAQHRALLTRCDVLLMPEQYGELRSILLEAMSFGMPVIASADAFIDMLVDGETASIVGRPDPEEWNRHLIRLLTDPAAARELGAGARERIATGHRSSDQVRELVSVLKRIVTGEVYPFEAAEA
ncbi:MAG: glycosyltransferase family 4 protein [Planctomycetes bacterium]|nr:glycosyltransferase family 4 protein [Planctomycetota bacterium]